MIKYIKYIILAAVAGGIYYAGYSHADRVRENEFLEFKVKSEHDYAQILDQKLKTERKLNDTINAVEKQRQEDIAALKDKYEKDLADIRADFKPSGVHSNCTASGSSGAEQTKPAPGVICYARNELLSRVEGTLAVGARCDQLAKNYNTLLLLIKEYNGNTSKNN